MSSSRVGGGGRGGARGGRDGGGGALDAISAWRDSIARRTCDARTRPSGALMAACSTTARSSRQFPRQVQRSSTSTASSFSSAPSRP
ncbi:MAG: hypothetical protein M5U28_19000 [Sandaracinaceae bacterium]|nr:hypothetical protein [Sandaracinaceae bacterium]